MLILRYLNTAPIQRAVVPRTDNTLLAVTPYFLSRHQLESHADDDNNATMATLIGDIFTDSPARFHNHNMIRASTLQHQHSHHFHQNPPIARSHEQDVVESQHTPRPTASSHTSSTTSRPVVGRRDWEDSPLPTENREKQPPLPRSAAGTAIANGNASIRGGAARLPSPPSSSSSSSETPSGGARPQQHTIPTDDETHDSSSSNSSVSTATAVVPPPPKSIPSPASDSEPRWVPDAMDPESLDALGHAPSSPFQEQKTIHVRDLAHVQALAKTDILIPAGSNSLNDPPLQNLKYEISAMPINDIIEMVAALLTKITTTNDLQHDALNRNAHHLRQAQAQAQEGKDNNHGMSPLSSSVLAFHGKNVPSISILSYLSRIHKYCPTTFEVFLSLLVYFDRMTERVNDMVVKNEESRRAAQLAQQTQQTVVDRGPGDGDTIMNDYDDDDDDTQSDETDEGLADTDEEKGTVRSRGEKEDEKVVSGNVGIGPSGQATYFVVDSYNIHRLIIAGVTCSSKFFSDVFYTNSRYAKVRLLFFFFFPLLWVIWVVANCVSGRRSPTCGAKPSRTTIPLAQRFSTFCSR